MNKPSKSKNSEVSKSQNDAVFAKLAEAESKFFESEFLSPVLRHKPIQVRIAGIVSSLVVTKPKNFQGWGVFKPTSYKECRFVREPNLTEQNSYLKLFPILRLILCRRVNDLWMGIPAHNADTRFKIEGLVSVQFAEEVQLFDPVQTRFDGTVCWFDGPDQGHDPKIAPYLRESLTNLMEPDKLSITGLTREEVHAYTTAYAPALLADIESRRDKKEDQIKDALARAGAKYRSYIERGNTYTIEYMVGTEQHRSVVQKDTLRVQSSGICLSGRDQDFDLQSLVGVLFEGQRKRNILRVGLERDYGYGYQPLEDDYDD